MTKRKQKKLTYADAGVDISKAEKATEKFIKHVKSTRTKLVLSNAGLFGGMIRFPKKEFKEPVLVASTDGVGTKLKVAYKTGIHDTIGQDLVNHCVNDILVQGAKPLFFLDYIGTGKLEPEVIADIVKGLAKACRQNNCALIGGETAEMPGIYSDNEYDLASCIVGVVEKSRIIDGSSIKPGDSIIALRSSGLHTNGYSLALKALSGHKLEEKPAGLRVPLWKELLKIHRSYLRPVSELEKKVEIRGMAHITGGGLAGNISRILPENCQAVIDAGSWKVPPIFRLIQEEGNIETAEMFRAFNMGAGFVIVVPQKEEQKAIDALSKAGEKPWLIGRITERRKNEEKVVLDGL